MPFSDPMADGPAIQAAGLRALKAGMTLPKTLEVAAPLPRQRRRHADRADGLLQPDLPLWRAAVPERGQGSGLDGLIVVDLPPEHDDELCLPALAAGIDFIRLATPTTDDKRLPAVLRNTGGLHLLRRDRRHHRHQVGGGGRGRRSGGAAEAAYRRCRSRSASASGRRPRPPRWRASPTRRWWARRWSRRLAARLWTQKGRATARPGRGRAQGRAGLGQGRAAARRGASAEQRMAAQ